MGVTIIVKNGRTAKRYWRREEFERVLRQGSEADIAREVPEEVQAAYIEQDFTKDSEKRDLMKRNFKKLGTDAIRRGLGMPNPVVQMPSTPPRRDR